MKKTIRLLGLMLVAAFAFGAWSCDDDDDDKVVAETELPKPAQTFLSTYYPNVNVVRTVRDKDNGTTEYEVLLANGHEVTFDAAGLWMDVDAPAMYAIPEGIAPEPIAEYVSTNYPQDGINEISRENYGYEVELVSTLDLRFDTAGAFLGIDR